jgi:putative membrane protein
MGRFDGWVRSVGEDPDPRFTLANERTFLSWMTTSLGLLGAGLAVGSLVPKTSAALTALATCWIGMSALVAVRALLRWFRLERAMRHNEALPLSNSIPIVAIALAALGLASGIALLVAR